MDIPHCSANQCPRSLSTLLTNQQLGSTPFPANQHPEDPQCPLPTPQLHLSVNFPLPRDGVPHGGDTSVPVPTESIPEDFYMRFGEPEVPPPSTLPFPTTEGPEGCPPPGVTKAKGLPKAPGGSAFPGGWEGGLPRGLRRPGPTAPLYSQAHRHLATNSKTEVTV